MAAQNQCKRLGVQEKLLMIIESSAVQETQVPSLGWGRSLGEGNGDPLQYPCLENLMDRGAWWAAVHGVTKSWAQMSD